MAGVLLHLAMGDPEKMNPEQSAYSTSYKKAYTAGLLMPDIAKQKLIRSRHDLETMFEGCDDKDILTYEDYLQFCTTHHFSFDPDHPGLQDTRNPDLRAFISTSWVDIRKPVWLGALCHLMGDKAFYYKSYCANDPQAMADYRDEAGEIGNPDVQKWRNSHTGRTYYDDYDVLNQRIEDEYHVLAKVTHYYSESAVKQLLNSFNVKFSAERTEPVYMNLSNIRKYIARSRQLMHEIDQGNLEEVLNCFNEDRMDSLFE